MGSNAEHPDLAKTLERWFLAIEDGANPNLEELCGGDIELLRQANRILSRESSVQALLDIEVPTDAHPRELGEFALLRSIGAGAWGASTLHASARSIVWSPSRS